MDPNGDPAHAASQQWPARLAEARHGGTRRRAKRIIALMRREVEGRRGRVAMTQAGSDFPAGLMGQITVRRVKGLGNGNSLCGSRWSINTKALSTNEKGHPSGQPNSFFGGGGGYRITAGKPHECLILALVQTAVTPKVTPAR